MKKITTVWILLFALSMVSNAQEKGKVILGGAISLQSADYESRYYTESTINKFTFEPEIGYQVNENFSLGLTIAYESTATTGSASGSGKAIGFIPYLRYTNAITGQLKYYVEPSAGQVFDVEDESENPTDNFLAGLDVGLQYFLTPKISCEISLAQFAYQYVFDGDTNEQLNQYGLSINIINPQLGFKFYF